MEELGRRRASIVPAMVFCVALGAATVVGSIVAAR
jgi:hypothetical protein